MRKRAQEILFGKPEEEAAFFCVRGEEVGRDDTTLQRFIREKLIPLFQEIEFEEYFLKKYVNALLPYREHTKSIYEIRAKQKNDGKTMISLVWVHWCPHEKQYEEWKVCKHANFKPYKADEVAHQVSEGPPLHLFGIKDLIPLCAC